MDGVQWTLDWILLIGYCRFGLGLKHTNLQLGSSDREAPRNALAACVGFEHLETKFHRIGQRY